jgi:hypothetical protein
MNPIAVNVGHVVNMALVALDQNGNPMLTQPTPDSTPTWTDAPAPAGAATLVVAANGLTAVDTAVEVGTDTVNATAIVSGVTYTATLPITISAVPQTLTSYEITAAVV